MKFPGDTQSFRDKLHHLGSEGWTIVGLDGLWLAKSRNDVLKECLSTTSPISLEVGKVSAHPAKVSTRVRWVAELFVSGLADDVSLPVLVH